MDDNIIQNLKLNTISEFLDNEESLVHIRLTKGRRGGKDTYVTIVEGLEQDLDFKKIIKRWRKMFNCIVCIKKSKITGNHVIQLSGDFSKEIKSWLLEQEIMFKKEHIIIHSGN